MLRRGFCLLFLVFPIFCLYTQEFIQGQHLYVLRGEVFVDLEPIYLGHVDEEYPLDIPTAGRRALEEAAMFYSAMIYGWSFLYDVGERARQIEENLELTALGTVEFGDPRLRVTDTQIRDNRFSVWTDYHLSDSQQNRVQSWSTGMIRNAQAVGHGPFVIDEYPGWFILKKSALEDAARVALRTMLRSSERNRPKEVTGFICLASFPRFYIESGRWAVSARFRVQITEIIPFLVH